MPSALQTQQDDADFKAAYSEDDAAPAAQTDDDAFGLTPEPTSLEADEGDFPETPEDAQEAPEEVSGNPMEAVESVETVHTPDEPVHEPVQPAGLTKEQQSMKSWEGRVKARIAELKAAGHDVDDLDSSESAEDEASESSTEQVGEAEAEKLKGMDPDEAMKLLASDFGDDFAQMLNAVIDAKVAKSSSRMSQSVDEIISDIGDTKARQHFETIADLHPDFMDIAASDDFKAFTAENAGSQAVVDTGSAREINKLLSSFKSSQAKPEPKIDSGFDAHSADAAEGVRSSGLRLPTQPGASKDYAAAWDEFSD